MGTHDRLFTDLPPIVAKFNQLLARTRPERVLLAGLIKPVLYLLGPETKQQRDHSFARPVAQSTPPTWSRPVTAN